MFPVTNANLFVPLEELESREDIFHFWPWEALSGQRS